MSGSRSRPRPRRNNFQTSWDSIVLDPYLHWWTPPPLFVFFWYSLFICSINDNTNRNIVLCLIHLIRATWTSSICLRNIVYIISKALNDSFYFINYVYGPPGKNEFYMNFISILRHPQCIWFNNPTCEMSHLEVVVTFPFVTSVEFHQFNQSDHKRNDGVCRTPSHFHSSVPFSISTSPNSIDYVVTCLQIPVNIYDYNSPEMQQTFKLWEGVLCWLWW